MEKYNIDDNEKAIVQTYACKMCKQTFTAKSTLTAHIKNKSCRPINIEKNKYRCECGSGYTTVGSLNRHKQGCSFINSCNNNSSDNDDSNISINNNDSSDDSSINDDNYTNIDIDTYSVGDRPMIIQLRREFNEFKRLSKKKKNKQQRKLLH